MSKETLYAVDMPNGLTYVGKSNQGPESNPLILKEAVTMLTRTLLPSYDYAVKRQYKELEKKGELRIDGLVRITHFIDLQSF